MYKILLRSHMMLKAIIIFCILFVKTSPLSASELEGAIPPCSVWVGGLQSFAEDCIKNARPFTRVFRPGGNGMPEVENHYVWFSKSETYGHFGMGCVLRSDKTVLFIGLYYSVDPRLFTEFNNLGISAVFFNGDVTLTVGDDHPSMIAIQPFDNSSTKTIWSSSQEIAKNCKDPHTDLDPSREGVIILPSYHTFVNLSHFSKDGLIEEGPFKSVAKTFSYTEFFPSDLPRQVIYSWYGVMFITSGGSILVRSEVYERACKAGNKRTNWADFFPITDLCQLETAK